MKGRKNKKLKWQVPGKNVMQGLSKVKDIWTKFQFILTGKQKRLAMVILLRHWVCRSSYLLSRR